MFAVGANAKQETAAIKMIKRHRLAYHFPRPAAWQLCETSANNQVRSADGNRRKQE